MLCTTCRGNVDLSFKKLVIHHLMTFEELIGSCLIEMDNLIWVVVKIKTTLQSESSVLIGLLYYYFKIKYNRFTVFLRFLFFCFFFFRAAPTGFGGSQARGLIEATAAHLCQSHSNSASEPHLRPTPQLTAMRDP